MKQLIIYILLSVLSLNAFAAKLSGRILDKQGEPIIGAAISWEESKTGIISDDNGHFEIEQKADQHLLVFRYIGYKSQTIRIDDTSSTLIVTLNEDTELQEVIISKSLAGRLKNRLDVLNTEKISSKELTRAACCNLSESFVTNPSVDVSYSDAVTGAKQIQLLGLAGTYVQMLTENYPNMRGTSAPYGMDYIPGPWMESIQVSKGAASVKNGYESLAGQVNIEYKKPKTADPLSLNVFASDASRYEANADGAIELNDKLSTGLFLHYSNEKGSHDSNGDGFLDMPNKHQLNLMNRWHYQTEKIISQSGFKFLNDERTSGQNTHSQNSSMIDPYTIKILTNRGELFTKNGFILDSEKNESLALILSGSYHDQKSRYAHNLYNTYQTNVYASLMYERDFGAKHKLSTGLSYNTDKYVETKQIAQLNEANQPNKESVEGGYAQYTFNKDDKLTILAGIRADYSSLHKWFITPRLHLKYKLADWMHLRASAGKGYKTVFAMPENSYILASSRKINITEKLKQENAWNYGLSSTFYIPIKGEELSITGEWFYTNFSNQVVMDMDSDPHAISFYNLRGNSYSNSFQVEASYPLFKGFSILGAYRWIEARTNYNGKEMRKPLTSRYKALLTASYETAMRKWQFDLTSQFNGGGRMPTPDANKPLWNTSFNSFAILNAQATKFFRNWSVYVGAENLTDFRQKNPIIGADEPHGSDFDATMVWGPTQGRMLYLGARFNIMK